MSLLQTSPTEPKKYKIIFRLEEMGNEAERDYLNAIKEYLDIIKVKYVVLGSDDPDNAPWEILLVDQSTME